MIVISYFTHAFYETKAARLVKSVENFGLRHDVRWVPDQGSWLKNTLMKAAFILERVQEHAQPVLWLDADAIVLRPLELFLAPSFDVAVYRYSPANIFLGSAWHSRGQVWNGTAYFAPTEMSRTVLRAWVDHNKAFGEDRLEQKNLATVMATIPDKSKFACLPPEYCWVERVMRRHMKLAEPAIIHEAARLSGTAGGKDV